MQIEDDHSELELEDDPDPVAHLRYGIELARRMFHINQRDGVTSALSSVRYFLSSIEGCETVFAEGSPLCALDDQLRYLDDDMVGPIFSPKPKNIPSYVWSARAHLAAAFDIRLRMGETREHAARRVLKDIGDINPVRDTGRADQAAQQLAWLYQLRKDAKRGFSDRNASFFWWWYQSRTRGDPAHEELYDVEYQRSLLFARNQMSMLKKAKDSTTD